MFTPDNNNHLRHHVIFTFHDCIESQKGEMEYVHVLANKGKYDTGSTHDIQLSIETNVRGTLPRAVV